VRGYTAVKHSGSGTRTDETQDGSEWAAERVQEQGSARGTGWASAAGMASGRGGYVRTGRGTGADGEARRTAGGADAVKVRGASTVPGWREAQC
jgi:hypothetical protein